MVDKSLTHAPAKTCNNRGTIVRQTVIPSVTKQIRENWEEFFSVGVQSLSEHKD